jgi:hypothetical protein
VLLDDCTADQVAHLNRCCQEYVLWDTRLEHAKRECINPIQPTAADRFDNFMAMARLFVEMSTCEILDYIANGQNNSVELELKFMDSAHVPPGTPTVVYTGAKELPPGTPLCRYVAVPLGLYYFYRGEEWKVELQDYVYTTQHSSISTFPPFLSCASELLQTMLLQYPEFAHVVGAKKTGMGWKLRWVFPPFLGPAGQEATMMNTCFTTTTAGRKHRKRKRTCVNAEFDANFQIIVARGGPLQPLEEVVLDYGGWVSADIPNSICPKLRGSSKQSQ